LDEGQGRLKHHRGKVITMVTDVYQLPWIQNMTIMAKSSEEDVESIEVRTANVKIAFGSERI
jgi:hypothetical protein